MDVLSSAETVSMEDGTVQLAFDLSGSDARYLIISTPANGGNEPDEFFGSDHYVEVKDQLFGQYGGLERLAVLDDNKVALRLVRDVPGVGRDLSITTAQPMEERLLNRLRGLERS